MAEININEKKVLDNFKEVLSAGNSNTQDIEQFIKIMELPDEDFDRMYPIMKERMEGIYNNPAYEKEILDNLKMEIMRDPNFNIEEQAAAAREFIKTIEEEEFSQNKKDFLKFVLENAVLKFIEIYNNPREKINVKIEKIDPNASIPTYAHPLDAGADIKALEETIIDAGETKIVRTGIKVSVPRGYEIQIRARSGLSAKTGLRLANSIGTIDSGYLGEVGVILHNTSSESYIINAGDKIAQMTIAPTPMIIWEETTITDETDRGEGGFGSTDA